MTFADFWKPLHATDRFLRNLFTAYEKLSKKLQAKSNSK